MRIATVFAFQKVNFVARVIYVKVTIWERKDSAGYIKTIWSQPLISTACLQFLELGKSLSGFGELVMEKVLFSILITCFVVASRSESSLKETFSKYKFHFKTGDTGDHTRTEESDESGSVIGMYSYKDPNGVLRTVRYKAAPELGYQAYGEGFPQFGNLPLEYFANINPTNTPVALLNIEDKNNEKAASDVYQAPRKGSPQFGNAPIEYYANVNPSDLLVTEMDIGKNNEKTASEVYQAPGKGSPQFGNVPLEYYANFNPSNLSVAEDKSNETITAEASEVSTVTEIPVDGVTSSSSEPKSLPEIESESSTEIMESSTEPSTTYSDANNNRLVPVYLPYGSFHRILIHSGHLYYPVPHALAYSLMPHNYQMVL